MSEQTYMHNGLLRDEATGALVIAGAGGGSSDGDRLATDAWEDFAAGGLSAAWSKVEGETPAASGGALTLPGTALTNYKLDAGPTDDFLAVVRFRYVTFASGFAVGLGKMVDASNAVYTNTWASNATTFAANIGKRVAGANTESVVGNANIAAGKTYWVMARWAQLAAKFETSVFDTDPRLGFPRLAGGTYTLSGPELTAIGAGRPVLRMQKFASGDVIEVQDVLVRHPDPV